MIGESLPKEAIRLARDLVFGTRDLKLDALRQLPRLREKAIPIVAEFVPDADALVREAAMEALILAGEEGVYDIVEERLKTEMDENVIHAVLRRVSPEMPRGAKLLASFVTAPNEDLAVAALNALSDGESNEAASRLKECLADKRWRVRVAALEYAGRIGSATGKADVLNAFNDSDEFVRYAAMTAAADMEDRGGPPRITAMAMKDDAIIGAAVEAIVRLGRPIPEEIVNVLMSKPGDALLVVLRAFGRREGHEGGQIDFGQLEEGASTFMNKDQERRAALQALKIVRMLAKHRDPDVRMAAFQVLGQRVVDPADKKLVYDAVISAPDDETRVAILAPIRPGGFDFRETTEEESWEDGKQVVTDSNDVFASVLAEPPPRNPAQEAIYAAFDVKVETPDSPAVTLAEPRARAWQPMDREFSEFLTKAIESGNSELAFVSATQAGAWWSAEGRRGAVADASKAGTAPAVACCGASHREPGHHEVPCRGVAVAHAVAG